jgi:cellulose synthase/poly-beta-1,6-N-acetylglucosamine synthase-like glycosyltransferase
MDPFLTWPVYLIAWAVLLSAYLLQYFFWLGPFLHLSRHAPGRVDPLPPDREKPVTLIVCARNEAQNLSAHLPRILNQKYRSLSIIVVDDHSSDHSEKVILDMQEEWPKLHWLSSVHSGSEQGKKVALGRGIRSAKTSWLLFTDADCSPASPLWVSKMARLFSEGNDLILGFSPYRKKGGWLNVWIRFEGLWTGIQYLSAAKWGRPYMGVGRNLAYRKEQIPDWSSHKNYFSIPSGDDDLLVNVIGDQSRTAICMDPQTFVWSEPKESWAAYFRQKRRHVGSSFSYQYYQKVLLVLLPASQMVLLPLSYGLGQAAPETGGYLVALWLARSLAVGFVGGVLARKLGQPDLAPWIWILDWMLPLYYVALTPLLFIPVRKGEW